MLIEAVIFDLDGVLWNSSPLHEQAFRMAFAEFGATLPPGFYSEIAGMRTSDATQLLEGRFLQAEQDTSGVVLALVARKKELAAGMLASLSPDMDIEFVIEQLRSAGIRIGLATSASRRTLATFLSHFPLSTFEVAVSSDEVSEAKPSPAIYREVARRLSVKCDRCIVVEDSAAGIEAAKGAGMHVVGYGDRDGSESGLVGRCTSLREVGSFITGQAHHSRVKLSICISNTNHRDLLDNALRSIAVNRPSCPFEVLVVDNASTDGSADMVRSKYPDVILTENSARLGYPANCNRNMAKASGEYFLILNEDIEILPGSIDAGIKFMDENLQVGLLGAAMILPTGELQLTSARHFPTILSETLGWSRLPELFPRSKFFGHYLMSYWGHDTIREVDLVLEAGMLVRRKAVDEVGMMDEGFFFCYDGPDWARRFWKSGWKVTFHPRMRIIHNEGQSSKIGKRPNPFILSETMKSSIRYYTKHHGRPYALAFRCSMVLVFLLYCLKHVMMLLLVWKSERREWLLARLHTSFLMFRWYLGFG